MKNQGAAETNRNGLAAGISTEKWAAAAAEAAASSLEETFNLDSDKSVA